MQHPGHTYGMITGDLTDMDAEPLSRQVICPGFLLFSEEWMCFPSPVPCSPLLSALQGQEVLDGREVVRLSWAQHLRGQRRWEKESPPSGSDILQPFTWVVDAKHFPYFKGLKKQEALAYLNNLNLVSGETKKVVKTQLTFVSSGSSPSVHSGDLEGGCAVGAGDWWV